MKFRLIDDVYNANKFLWFWQGVTRIENVKMKSFENQECDGKTRESHALMTHSSYGDIIHPMTLQNVKLENVGDTNKVWYDKDTTFLLFFYILHFCLMNARVSYGMSKILKKSDSHW